MLVDEDIAFLYKYRRLQSIHLPFILFVQLNICDKSEYAIGKGRPSFSFEENSYFSGMVTQHTEMPECQRAKRQTNPNKSVCIHISKTTTVIIVTHTTGALATPSIEFSGQTCARETKRQNIEEIVGSSCSSPSTCLLVWFSYFYTTPVDCRV